MEGNIGQFTVHIGEKINLFNSNNYIANKNELIKQTNKKQSLRKATPKSIKRHK